MRLHRMVVSDTDYEKLIIAVEDAMRSRPGRSPHLELFEAQLRRARVVPPHDVPSDLITMHSRFEFLRRGGGGSGIVTLIYPDEHEADGLSVLSPIGRAVLAARVGDEVGWVSATGPESARVLSLHQQPEWKATCEPACVLRRRVIAGPPIQPRDGLVAVMHA